MNKTEFLKALSENSIKPGVDSANAKDIHEASCNMLGSGIIDKFKIISTGGSG